MTTKVVLFHAEFSWKNTWDCYILPDAINLLRAMMMVYSFVGVIFSIYVNQGHVIHCTEYIAVSYSDLQLSILFTIYYSLILFSSSFCMPFHNFSFAVLHYLMTFLMQFMIIILLAMGCIGCSIFNTAQPVPLMICTLISPICFSCNLGTACLYIIEASRSKMMKERKQMIQTKAEALKVVDAEDKVVRVDDMPHKEKD